MNRIFHPFRKSSRQLGPLEQRLLERLWARGSATVRELVEDECDDLAYTTLMTTLDRLFKKDFLRAARMAGRFDTLPDSAARSYIARQRATPCASC